MPFFYLKSGSAWTLAIHMNFKIKAVRLLYPLSERASEDNFKFPCQGGNPARARRSERGEREETEEGREGQEMKQLVWRNHMEKQIPRKEQKEKRSPAISLTSSLDITTPQRVVKKHTNLSLHIPFVLSFYSVWLLRLEGSLSISPTQSFLLSLKPTLFRLVLSLHPTSMFTSSLSIFFLHSIPAEQAFTNHMDLVFRIGAPRCVCAGKTMKDFQRRTSS